MKLSLTIADFLVIFLVCLVVGIVSHYCLTHRNVEIKDNSGAVVGTGLKPTLFGGME